MNFLPNEEAHNEITEAQYLREEAVELKMKIEGRIFELEKEQLRSRRGEKSLFSWKTSHPCMSQISSTSQVSVLKLRTMTELAGREVEIEYVKIEAEMKM